MALFEQTYSLQPGARVEIEQGSGTIRIVGWEQPVLRLKAVTSGDGDIAERIRVDAGTHRLAIEVVDTGSWFSFGRGGTGVDLDLMVPVGTRLGLETASGEVWVENTLGPVSVEAGSGNLTMTGVRGAVDLEIGSGDVVLRAVAGTVKVETGSGDIHVAEIDGPIELESGSGDVRADRVHSSRFHVSTGGGDLNLERIDAAVLDVESSHGDLRLGLAAVHPEGRYSVECSSGNVTVLVPPSANLTLRVESSGGRIRHEGLDLRTVRMEQGELDAVLGSGGARLAIECSAGDVSLGPAPVEAPHLQVVRADKALENSEQVQRVLRMVEEGKLSPEEASQLLAALDEEEVSFS